MSSGDPDSPRLSPAWWDDRYATGESPWDSGIVPPEVQDLVGSGWLRPGWALDLGCGRGTSSRYLARHGFRVAGLDLSFLALSDAQRLAAADALPAFFCAGNVIDLGFLNLRATFALDIGCFHSLEISQRSSYVISLATRLLPAAYYLLYALYPAPEDQRGPAGLTPSALAVFAPYFVVRWARHGYDRNRPSAWYLLQRAGY